jgi:hypothetical protein
MKCCSIGREPNENVHHAHLAGISVVRISRIQITNHPAADDIGSLLGVTSTGDDPSSRCEAPRLFDFRVPWSPK